ncbi:DUF481 domain-containing protein [Sediminibacterium sp.]|uniref:DUF481 domain-containing protein n=1 Tax=Sediminibacterium sp. TaxID=1917865 RepID=UPI003F6E70E7
MKNRLYLYLLIVLISCSEKVSAEVSDSLEMENGKILVGEFLGWLNNEISFCIPDVGIVAIKYEKVRKLNANSNKYHIETYTGKIFYNKLICINPRDFLFIENGIPISIKFKEIEMISPLKKGVLTNGFIGLGYNYSKFTNYGLITIDGGVNFKTENWVFDIGANSMFIHKESNGLERIRESANIKIDHNVNARWQFATRYIYQRNKELGLAYRHLAGGGLLYKIIRRSILHLNFSTGIAAMAEGTFDNQNYNRYEIPFLLEVRLSRLGNSNMSLYHTQILFIGTGNNKRIRHDGELRLNLLFNKKLSLTTYIFNNYDSAPVQKIETNKLDYGWNTGLRYAF